MTIPRYGFGGPWWDHAWPDYPRCFYRAPRESDYFIFVEDVTSVTADGLFRPDGVALSVDADFGERPWRFRSSGVGVRKFLDVMDQFEPLDHVNVTNGQRTRRRDQLIEVFGNASLPMLDLYANEKDEDLPFLRAIVTAGSWYWIGVRRREERDPRLPIFVGAPELDAGPYLPGSLDFFEAVPPFIEYRLRDIFSLVHVPDAGIEGIGGETTPSPDKPQDESLRTDYSSNHNQGAAPQGPEA